MDFVSICNLVPCPVNGVFLRKEEFGGILVGGNLPILSLNHEAVKLWNMFDGHQTIGKIFDTLALNYDSDDLKDVIVEYVEYCVNNQFLVLENRKE